MNAGSPGIVPKGIPVPRYLLFVQHSYRTHRSSGYCGTGVQNSHTLKIWYTRTPGIRGNGVQSLLQEVPGTGMNVTIQNFQKFRERGYEFSTELTEVLSRIIPGKNTPGMVCAYPTEPHLEMFDLTAGWIKF